VVLGWELEYCSILGEVNYSELLVLLKSAGETPVSLAANLLPDLLL